LPAGWCAKTDRDRPLGVATAEVDVQGLAAYAVAHNLDAHIGALAVHRR
jgi:hypothetical protein